MLVVEICRVYGWDYFQYYSQPTAFIDLITERMVIDAKKAEAENKKTQAANARMPKSARMKR